MMCNYVGSDKNSNYMRLLHQAALDPRVNGICVGFASKHVTYLEGIPKTNTDIYGWIDRIVNYMDKTIICVPTYLLSSLIAYAN